MTHKEWKLKNPSLEGNIRDYADVLHLIILSNLEVLNSEMISNGIIQSERLKRLNDIAKHQLTLLSAQDNIVKIKEIN